MPEVSGDSHHLVHTVGALGTQEGGLGLRWEAEVQAEDRDNWAERDADAEAPGREQPATASTQRSLQLPLRLGPNWGQELAWLV